MHCSVSVRLCESDNKRETGFGKGIVMLLDGIEKYGSINQATHAMGMAYSKAWRIIKATEAEFGVLLVDRDGAHGSSITPQARELMETYRRLLSEAQDAADAVLAEK
mgnify:CR=1 FL=1